MKKLNKRNNNTKEKTSVDITIHKDSALKQLDSLLSNYINEPAMMLKADKLSYWLEDLAHLIKSEETFDPIYLKKYNRGDIIQANLGFNIGNEEGGLHYCVVLDKHNSQKSGIVTVIPLTSDKGKKLDYSEISLGNEVYTSFKQKYEILIDELSQKVSSLNKNSDKTEIRNTLEKLDFLEKMNAKMSKMKKGSIAMVSQITTISKQKIYDPQKTTDLLSDVRISDKSLDLINEKMKQLFIKI